MGDMTDAAFAATQQRILLTAGIVAELDLVSYIERIEDAEKRGPTLYPGVWEKAAPRLAQLKEMAKVLVNFQLLALEAVKAQLEEERSPRIIIPGVNDG